MRRSAAGAALVALLALSGCVRITSETTFHPDETVSQHVVMAAEPGALTTLQDQLGTLPEGMLPGVDQGAGATLTPGLELLLDPDALEQQLDSLGEDVPGTVDVAPYSDDEGREGVELTVTDVPLSALSELEGLPATLGASPAVSLADGAYTVVLDTGAASALASSGADTRALGLAEAAIDFSVDFTFPGLVREASAGTIAGNTVSLGLQDLLGSDQIRIVAGAAPERDWGPLLKWGLVGLGAAALIGGAIALVLQDRRRRTTSTLPPPRPAGEGPGTLTDRAPER